MGEPVTIWHYLLIFAGIAILVVFFKISRRRLRVRGAADVQYAFRKDAAALYFDGPYLVVNLPPPAKPYAVETDDIKFVKFEKAVSSSGFWLGVFITRKNGSEVTGPYLKTTYDRLKQLDQLISYLEAHGIEAKRI